MPLKIESRRHLSDHGELTLVRITNSRGESVELSSLGAGILAVEVADATGKIENVALGYADPADYMADGPCMGKCPGRYANRIARGHLTIGGRDYQLAVNNGPNHLHGGPAGFQNHIWDTEILEDGVRFSRISPDGEENYPGNVKVSATYRWSDNSELSLVLEAETDAPTVINLTNHSYWNLRGAESGQALDHTLQLFASRYLPTDDTLIPLPEAPADVKDTPMDFLLPKPFGRDMRADFPALRFGKGYDACWVIDGYETPSVKVAAILSDPVSRRRLTVLTDQPGVQVYGGNWLAGSPKGRNGADFADYDGIAIEAQGWPDAPNRPDFPSQLVTPATPYRRTIIFRFG